MLKWAQSWNQIKTFKECLCCHIYWVRWCTPLYRTVTAFCTVFNRESRYPLAARCDLLDHCRHFAKICSNSSCWSLGTACQWIRRIVGLCATVLQALYPPLCAPVETLSPHAFLLHGDHSLVGVVSKYKVCEQRRDIIAHGPAKASSGQDSVCRNIPGSGGPLRVLGLPPARSLF